MQYADRKNELRSLMQNLHLEMVGVYSGANFIYPDVLGEELYKIEQVARLAAEFGAIYLVVGGGAVVGGARQRAGGHPCESFAAARRRGQEPGL